MEEDVHGIKGIREDVPGVGPPFTGCFARQWHHGVDEHDEIDRSAITDQGGCESGERLRNEDDLLALSNGSKDGVGIFTETCCVIVAGQVHGDGDVSEFFEVGHHQVPQPRV